MAASVLQAGPMVQIIFARRGDGFTVAGSAICSGLLRFNLSPIGVRNFGIFYLQNFKRWRALPPSGAKAQLLSRI